MTTHKLAAAVERPQGSSGRGEPGGPSAAGRPDDAASGGLPRPGWGAGARQATHVRARLLGGRRARTTPVTVRGRTQPGPAARTAIRAAGPHDRRCHMSRSAYGLDTPRAGHWTDRAYCRALVARGVAPDTWWPTSEAANGPEAIKAKRYCEICPARTDCLAYALKTGQEWGVWGGLTGRERRALARQGVA
jgi:WhiB family redox-sensing transcriptional regulator